MARAARRTRRARTRVVRRRTRPVTAPPPTFRASSRPIIRWEQVSRVAEALAGTVTDQRDDVALVLLSIVRQLVAPHAVLMRLHELTALVLDGDRNAANEMRRRIGDLLDRLPEARTAARQVFDMPDVVGCGPETPHDPDSEGAAAEAIVDETALLELSLAVSTAAACESEDRRQAAVEAVFGLVFMAAPLDRLQAALHRAGLAGIAREMASLAVMRSTPVPSPPPMQLMSGAGPGIPGLPGGGLPGGPGLPGPGFPGGPGKPPRGDDLPGWLRDQLKGMVKGPKRWDPELMDHRPVKIFDPPFVDTARIRCQIALFAALMKRQEPPPARPARVVWADWITAIVTTGACVGDQATIRGNFPMPKPANVGLVLPLNGVCTPLAIPPASWTATSIQFTLPAGITSGPIGFVDLDYVKAYNAWVDRMNAAAADAIAAARCAHVTPPSLPILPYFAECPPQTPVNRLRAGSALIKSFTVNLQTVAVAEPADPLTLAWDVVNAEQITIQRTSPSGPLFFGAVTLLGAVPFSSFALGPAGNTGPTRLTYRLTAVGPCGTVIADLAVIATKRPGLRIDAIEVTQGIQTIPASVRMVAQKPTVVRVTAGHGLAGWGANAVPNVTGRMRVSVWLSPLQWSGWFDPVNGSNPMAATPGAAITVPAAPQRGNTNDTLNFLIPPFLAAGTVKVQVEVRVTGFDVRPGFSGFNESVIRTVGDFTFEQRATLDLRFVRVNWGGATPTAATCDATLRAAVPLLPTPTAVIVPLAGVGVQNPSGTANADRNALLEDFYDRHNCSAWEAATEWLGSDCPDEDQAIWILIPGVFFQGRSRGIPSNVGFTPPNDGPYAAHELAHCLNQQHLGVACPNGQTAPGGATPGSWPNGGVLADVPFDVGLNATVTGAGGTVWDLLTYCGTPTAGGGGSNNTWPTPQRWQQLWDFNGA